MQAAPTRTLLLYLAPWVDFGGTDKNTIDWFRALDRERFAPSLITTQPSPNRRLAEIAAYAEEVWVLPDLMPAEDMPGFILDFLVSRRIEVVHLMNSKLGFDLLPDITCLPEAPRIVVQLHVEEADRSGYVRYVTTRYGNLVDRFSATSENLAAAVQGYGIPAGKTKVVYIGVDGEEEFAPDRVEPVEGLAEELLQILFPARIVQQKDPLLMVEVARRLRDRGVSFQIHVLGEGDLEDAVRIEVAKHGLGDHVLLHPPTSTPQRWYAASDAVLLTSEFEGVPAVVYEAMAMGLPIVSSSLPGNAELLGADYDGLVEPRDAVDRYVELLAKLAEDAGYREAHGRELRERALERFTLGQMVAGHEELYAELAAGRRHDEAPVEAERPEPLRFRDRPLFEQPLVSILVPHYNQAGVLGDCVDSVWNQTYPNVELVVVDDCSTEEDTARLLDELEAQDDVTVLRLDRNGGPSRARNLGLEKCRGRYVLPVDADNVLLPDAVERLVEQLSAAPEDVGFIYPNLQFFGNREDYYEPPAYNLYTLLHGNYCDTCSLIDREVFDAGLRYREEIVLGHEDWEFVLRLAARGVRGEAAHMPTVRYRKWGFNRSDAVDRAPTPFDDVLREISPFVGHEERIKGEESPSLTIACLHPLAGGEAARALAALLRAQSSLDAELIAPIEEEWADAATAPQLRRLPLGAARDPMEAFRRTRELMRGSLLMVSEDPELALLADPAFVEKALRRFLVTGPKPDALAIVDAGAGARFPFWLLDADEVDPARVHAVVWNTAAEKQLPWTLHLDPDAPAQSLARLFSSNGAAIEWRQGASGRAAETVAAGSWQPAEPLGPAAVENALVQPLLPGAGRYEVPRWDWTPTWHPTLSALLVRYRRPRDGRRLITSGPHPEGYELERHLGFLRSTSFEGTERLIRIGEEYVTVPRGEWEPLPDDAEDLGYLEAAPFPELNCLALGVHRESGQQLLISMPDDPLIDEVEFVAALGFLDPYPIKPRYEAPEGPPLGLTGLVKAIDHENRRHRYAIGEIPPGELVGELGALADQAEAARIRVWIVDGRLYTDRHAPPAGKPSRVRAARWVAEPAVWRGMASGSSRAKTALRRSAIAASRLRAAAAAPDGIPTREPDAWLYEGPRPGMSPLYASYHPVTGDQLLTRSPHDPAHMGYEGPHPLGFVKLAAPLTGSLEQSLSSVPWARRFGAVPRSG